MSPTRSSISGRSRARSCCGSISPSASSRCSGLTALAATSTDGMVRRLGGKRWQRLHQIVYGIGAAGADPFLPADQGRRLAADLRRRPVRLDDRLSAADQAAQDARASRRPGCWLALTRRGRGADLPGRGGRHRHRVQRLAAAGAGNGVRLRSSTMIRPGWLVLARRPDAWSAFDWCVAPRIAAGRARRRRQARAEMAQASPLSSVCSDKDRGRPMATFLVAHGAWSAGWAWKKMHPLMAARGHRLLTPTYTGLGERGHSGASATFDLDIAHRRRAGRARHGRPARLHSGRPFLRRHGRDRRRQPRARPGREARLSRRLRAAATARACSRSRASASRRCASRRAQARRRLARSRRIRCRPIRRRPTRPGPSRAACRSRSSTFAQPAQAYRVASLTLPRHYIYCHAHSARRRVPAVPGARAARGLGRDRDRRSHNPHITCPEVLAGTAGPDRGGADLTIPARCRRPGRACGSARCLP